MLTTSTFAGSSAFFRASIGNSLSAAPPAGEPSFLPAMSEMVLIGDPAFTSSAKGAFE